MSKQSGSRSSRWSRSLAAAGAVIGLAGGLFLGGLRLVNSEAPLLQAEWAGNVAFTLVYLAPFLLALLALRWSAAWQAIAWSAAALLGALGIFTAFSGVSFVLLPAALLLAPAALLALAQSAPRRWPAILLLVVVLVALGSAAWLSLITGSDDGRCWELVRNAAGETTWRAAPYHGGGPVTANSAGEEPGVVQVQCTSDIITAGEAGLALLLLALAGGLIAWVGRRWPLAVEAG